MVSDACSKWGSVYKRRLRPPPLPPSAAHSPSREAQARRAGWQAREPTCRRGVRAELGANRIRRGKEDLAGAALRVAALCFASQAARRCSAPPPTLFSLTGRRRRRDATRRSLACVTLKLSLERKYKEITSEGGAGRGLCRINIVCYVEEGGRRAPAAR